MEKAKIRPFATRKPFNRYSLKIGRRDYVLDGTRQNFVAIGSEVFVPQIRNFAVL